MILALGVVQVVSWGSLFYAIGVLGPAMRAELHVSEVFLMGAFTAGLLVSGTLAPFVGRMVDERGGRVVLSIGSLLAIAALVVLATSINAAQLAFGWILAGVAMSACLYDSAFATLSQHTGTRYRMAVTVVTLFGGFASTVFWPLSYLLMEAYGWRATLGIYAWFHLFLCLPIHLLVIPRKFGLVHAPPAPVERGSPAAVSTASFRWLMVSFAIATFVFSVFAVHIVTIMTDAGLTAAQAVSLSMLVGPMQVLGRIVELALAKHIRAVTMGLASFSLMLLVLAALLTMKGPGVAPLLFVAAYGCGNGLLTIIRGIAPAELFGRNGLGKIIGYLARTSLYSRALAPASFSAMLVIGLSRHESLIALTILAAAGFVSYGLAIRSHRVDSRLPRVEE